MTAQERLTRGLLELATSRTPDNPEKGYAMNPKPAGRIAALAAAAALALGACDTAGLQTTPPPPTPTVHVTRSAGVGYRDVASMRERIRAAMSLECGDNVGPDYQLYKTAENDGRFTAICDVVPGGDHVLMNTYASAQQEAEWEANYRAKPLPLLWLHFGEGWSVSTFSKPTLDAAILALTGHAT